MPFLIQNCPFTFRDDSHAGPHSPEKHKEDPRTDNTYHGAGVRLSISLTFFQVPQKFGIPTVNASLEFPRAWSQTLTPNSKNITQTSNKPKLYAQNEHVVHHFNILFLVWNPLPHKYHEQKQISSNCLTLFISFWASCETCDIYITCNPSFPPWNFRRTGVSAETSVGSSDSHWEAPVKLDNASRAAVSSCSWGWRFWQTWSL